MDLDQEVGPGNLVHGCVDARDAEVCDVRGTREEEGGG